LLNTPYKQGFITSINTKKFPRGVDLKIIKQISRKKREPLFLLNFRKKAFEKWKKMQNPT
jgi:Fe-S cluster assembly protein SufB